MLGKQAEAILSDLVMKCEEAGLRLPAVGFPLDNPRFEPISEANGAMQDPWDALAEALDALRSVNHHEMVGVVSASLQGFSADRTGLVLVEFRGGSRWTRRSRS